MGSHCNRVRMSRVSLLVVFLLAAAVSAKKQVERHPKLFFVSTSSTTSTLSTATLCYITTTPFSNSCTGRKRRAINFEGASVDESELNPSQLKEDVQFQWRKTVWTGRADSFSTGSPPPPSLPPPPSRPHSASSASSAPQLVPVNVDSLST